MGLLVQNEFPELRIPMIKRTCILRRTYLRFKFPEFPCFSHRVILVVDNALFGYPFVLLSLSAVVLPPLIYGIHVSV